MNKLLGKTLSLMVASTLVARMFAAEAMAAPATPAPATPGALPTIVLVHGAFADSASWNGVASNLRASGYTVVGAPNPLRGVQSDAEVVASLARSVAGPVVLVGHSYGGAVISQAAAAAPNVRALVFVAAFAPDKGETAVQLATRFPGSTLGDTLKAVEGPAGKDLYIQQDKFHAQFAHDVSPASAGLMAVGQRPIAETALNEAARNVPAWKTLPSWFIYGTGDKNIPAKALGYMAERAGSRKTVTVEGASHVVMTSHPDKVAALIGEAARAGL